MWLIGMMGSGKSTVGRFAAERLGVAFHDTDRMVEESAGTSIAEIWRTRGEAAFRDLETAALESVLEGGIAAAGGGAVLRKANRSLIARSEVVVWLRCEVEELARRIGATAERPLLAGDAAEESTLRQIMSERAPLYEALSTHQVDTTGRSLDQVVSEVIHTWPG